MTTYWCTKKPIEYSDRLTYIFCPNMVIVYLKIVYKGSFPYFLLPGVAFHLILKVL